MQTGQFMTKATERFDACTIFDSSIGSFSLPQKMNGFAEGVIVADRERQILNSCCKRDRPRLRSWDWEHGSRAQVRDSHAGWRYRSE